MSHEGVPEVGLTVIVRWLRDKNPRVNDTSPRRKRPANRIEPSKDGEITAAVAAAHSTIPASIRTADESTAAVWQAVENLVRVDLTPSQEARQTARIMAAGMKQKALAAAINRPLSWVRARLAMVGLPTTVQEAIDAGTYEPSDALTFAKYADRPAVIEVVLADSYRTGSDLDWRLQRAAAAAEHAGYRQAMLDQCAQAGWAVFEGYDPTSTHRGAKPLAALGIEHTDHAGESCHLVVISGSRHQRPDMAPWCTHPRRHITKGVSDVQVDDERAGVVSVDDDRAAAEREAKRAAKAARARRDDFVRQAIAAKLRGRDLTDFVLPVLFDVAGQTELTAAGKLLQVDPHTPQYHGGAKDYATPLRQWASQSTANLTRAMLAIAYVHATLDATYASDTWRQTSRQAVAGWLDRLGYQPEP